MASPPAFMGYVGYVRIESGVTFGIRCDSCDLKLTQTINPEEVVASRFDRTVYRLGPKEVGGSIGFPAVMDPNGGGIGSVDVVPQLWLAAIERDPDGRMLHVLNTIKVKYTSDNATFDFHNCLVDQFKFTVAQSEMVKMNIDIIGKSRECLGTSGGYLTDTELGGERNARALTWNDVYLKITLPGGDSFTGEWVRNFELTLQNNIERFYTLNGCLSPQDIAAKIRAIDGSMTIMGRNPLLGEYAAKLNEGDCYADGSIHCGYFVSKCQANWGINLPGVIYEIEQMSLKNDLMESTVAWHSYPGSPRVVAIAGGGQTVTMETFVEDVPGVVNTTCDTAS